MSKYIYCIYLKNISEKILVEVGIDLVLMFNDYMYGDGEKRRYFISTEKGFAIDFESVLMIKKV